MNPLDFTGPEFLGFYTVLLAVASLVAAALRWYLRQPAGEPDRDSLSLSAYDVAYLSGGGALACNAALARLVHDGILEADSVRRRVRVLDELPAQALDIERAVHRSAHRGKDGESVEKLRVAAAGALEPMRSQLMSAGLIVAPDKGFIARLLPALLILCVLALGVAKIFVGISRDKPVAFLLVLCLITAGIAAGFGKPVLRTRRGDRALAILKKSNSAMEYALRRHHDDISGNDIVLAVGLFGIGAVSGGPMTKLRLALAPAPSSGTDGGSSCSSGSSCGGGCGGGGCGGCGS